MLGSRAGAALVLFAGLLVSPAVAAATCRGETATLQGSPGQDVIVGTAGNDVISAGDGNDSIDGGGGADRICAGAGADLLLGDGGDVLDGGGGTDVVDYAQAGTVEAELPTAGRPGIAMVNAGASDKLIAIEDLTAGAANDQVAGGDGVNHIDLGAGNDNFIWSAGDTGDDVVTGGDGIDWLIYARATAPVSVDLASSTSVGPGTGTDQVAGFENVSGSFLGGTIEGDGANNYLISSIEPFLGGPTTIDGGAGDDQLAGSIDDDELTGGDGLDQMESGAFGVDQLNGGADRDILGTGGSAYLSPDPVTMYGGSEDDLLTGRAGADELFGEDGPDQIDGREGNDTIFGGPGADNLYGGGGEDSCPDYTPQEDGSGTGEFIGCASSVASDSDTGTPPADAPMVDVNVLLDGPPTTANGETTYTFKVSNPGESQVSANFWAFMPAKALSISFPGYSGSATACPRPFLIGRPDPFYSFLGRTIGCSGVPVPAGGTTTVTVTTDAADAARAGLAAAYEFVPYTSVPQPLSLDPDTTNNVASFTGPCGTCTSVKVIGIEITQGIQNLRNVVPLIADRTTYVLVHLRSSTRQALPNIGGSLEVRSPSGSTTLSGSPMTAPAKTITARTGGFMTFALPNAYLNGTIDVEFSGTGAPVLCRDPAGVTGDCVASGTFAAAPPLDIVLVPVSWGTDLVKHAPTQAELDEAFAQILSVMPVPSLGTSFVHAQTLGMKRAPIDLADFDHLNQRVARVRSEDGCGSGCSTFYLGVVVDPSNKVEANGLALDIPSFVASAYLRSPSRRILAHELGHAIGRRHTKCESEAGPDPKYPYKNGVISPVKAGPDAFYGFNILNQKALGSTSLDLMCDNAQWPSDYTWAKLKARLGKIYGVP